MVGNEEGNGYQCYYVPGVRCSSRCGSLGASRTGLPECFYILLESQSLTYDGYTKDQVAAKARAQAGLHDQGGGGEVFMARPPDSAPRPLLPDWVVHRIEAECDHGPEVVDDQS
jgi:hypothetical protein